MYYKNNNISIYYEKYGVGNKTIFILPGWGDTRSTFYNIINAFKDKYTIYIVDYPGFGKSKVPTKELSVYDYADIICNLLKYLKIKKPIIIAHSFGGRITALLLSKYKLVAKKIILFDVAGIKRRKSFKIFIKEKIYKFLKYFVRCLPKSKQEKYRKKLLDIFSSNDYRSLPKCMMKTFQNIISVDLRYDYQKINCPTLIIWGDKDYDTPLKDAYYINKKVNDSGLIIYKGAGHFSYLNYPQLTINILNKFI